MKALCPTKVFPKEGQTEVQSTVNPYCTAFGLDEMPGKSIMSYFPIK